VREIYDCKLVGHVSRDSTAINGREKPAKKAISEIISADVVLPQRKGRLLTLGCESGISWPGTPARMWVCRYLENRVLT
jgi:hypothetical protein